MAPNNPPRRIGRYELEQHLGGGMSAVYRARDTLINRPVALKLLKETFHPDDPMAQRFMLEAQIAGNLTHENVIRTYDFGFDPEGRPYMVMEFLEGPDLAQVIKSGGGGDLANRARIGWELAGALEYIHPQNVIHRDLKPANVVLAGAAGTVKLMDFGISRTEGIALTQTGMTMGTPGYMAPEQIKGEDVTKAADIYAFGVLLWELFTNRRAYSAPSVDRVFYMALNDPLDGAALTAAGVPEELARQICVCAAKAPGERPADLTAIRRELKRLMARPADTGPTVGRLAVPVAVPAAAPVSVAESPAKSNFGMLVGLGVALVAVALLAAWWMSGGKGEAPVRTATKVLAPEIVDGGAMVLVPAGSFLYGKEKTAVTLPAYYMDQTEVSNEAYRAFARATARALPPEIASAVGDLPVVNVSFDDALAYARWANKRLPSPQEWVKAARGADGRAYPWGEAADPASANVKREGVSGAIAVTASPAGRSPFRVLHMVGNVWEWVDATGTPQAEEVKALASELTPAPTAAERWVEIRGGSFAEPLDASVLTDRLLMPARYRNRLIGFRCVKSAE